MSSIGMTHETDGTKRKPHHVRLPPPHFEKISIYKSILPWADYTHGIDPPYIYRRGHHGGSVFEDRLDVAST